MRKSANGEVIGRTKTEHFMRTQTMKTALILEELNEFIYL